MSRPWDDCKFFLAGTCRNNHCTFRHSTQAKDNDQYCSAWAAGQCQDMSCTLKHAHTLANVPCRFEFTPGGCTNAACGFKHTLPRDDGNLQKKLALFLAEHEKSKEVDSAVPALAKASEEEDEDLDLDALRAQALKSVDKAEKLESTKPKKRKSGPEPGELVDSPDSKPKKAKKNEPLSNVRLRLGPVTNNRRVITTHKSEYSDDEVSDFSLDELTDEEPEDLRATLNKNKTVKRIHNVTITKSVNNGERDRLIRKINVSPTKKKDGQSRLITLRGVTNEHHSDSQSRPSSSEWIERKISVKPKQKQITRCVRAKVSSSEYSDASQEEDVKPKRKPNLAWVGLRQNETTEEDDLARRKLSSEQNFEFHRRITVNNDQCNKIKDRLGVKGRLGNTTTEVHRTKRVIKTGIKSRLGDRIKNDESEPPKKKIIALRKTIVADTKKSEPSLKEELDEPLPEKSPVVEVAKIEESKPARTESSSSSKKLRLNSTQDLENDLLNGSGSDLDDLEIGQDIDDDELFN